jgi:hypothetical protein
LRENRIGMNRNSIFTDGFSNPDTAAEYAKKTAGEGWIEHQCGGCGFFAPFNADYGLCCHLGSRFHLETVFEHFGCERQVNEGWGAHSFREHPFRHDRDALLALLARCERELSRRRSVASSDAKALLLEIRDALAERDRSL